MGEADRYSNYRIKKPWRDRIGKDAITVLIAAHVVGFVLFLIILAIYQIPTLTGYDKLMSYFTLPTSAKKLLFQPWSIFTYSITDFGANFFRVLSNMVWLFFYGQILRLYTRDAVIIPVFIYGTIFGALGFIVFCSIPSQAVFQELSLYGAHNGVFALATAATFLAPTYKILPQLRGGISLWIVTLIYILLNVGSVSAVGSGYGVGLLVAGAAGLVFSVLLKKDIDITNWMNRLWQGTQMLFVQPIKKPAKEVVFYKTGNREPFSKDPIVTDKKIDELLDKISEYGMDSLTAKEKEILRKHSEGSKD